MLFIKNNLVLSREFDSLQLKTFLPHFIINNIDKRLKTFEEYDVVVKKV
jgi:hypothetical protein